jgi:hypothetical protein
MTKTVVASACIALLVLAGCGGSDQAAKRKTACSKAAPALRQYVRVGTETGLNILDPKSDKRVIAAAGALSSRVDELTPFVSAGQRTQLQGLRTALAQQSKILGALAVHDTSAAHKAAESFDEKALDGGRATLERVCHVSVSL